MILQQISGFQDVITLGAKFNQYFTSTDISSYSFSDEYPQFRYSTYNKITFTGLTYSSNNFDNNSGHKLSYGFGLGLLSIRETYSDRNLELSGNTLGLDFNISYQYALTDYFFIGPKRQGMYGTISRVSDNYGQTYNLGDSKKSLNRLGIHLCGTFFLFSQIITSPKYTPSF